MKLLIKIVLVLLFLAGGLVLALFGGGKYLNAPPDNPTIEASTTVNSDTDAPGTDNPVFDHQAGEPVVFEVEQGETVIRLAGRLEDLGLIRSARLLVLLTRVKKTQTRIKSGFYRLAPGMTTMEIHDVLVAGAQELKSVTLPEGWTAAKMGQRLEEARICSSESFLSAVASTELLEKFKIPADSLEGYLFPDTYRFVQAYPAEKVVEHLVATFFEELELIDPQFEELAPSELHKRVIMASIVEREYRDPGEADKIASVFYNRLKKNMRLQSCATVVYVLTEEKGQPHPSKLTYRDLEVESVFNTYRNWGLPPAPIANPGSAALRGALFPADTDYLFFLLQDPDAGKHVFSRTLADHQEAYTLYIKQ